MRQWARENLHCTQHRQETTYNRGARWHAFQLGDRVLLFLPSSESKLLAKWQGPFEVTRRVGEVDYEIRQPGRRRETHIYHMTLLKPWLQREALLGMPSYVATDRGPELPVLVKIGSVQIGSNLTPEHRQQAQGLTWCVLSCPGVHQCNPLLY